MKAAEPERTEIAAEFISVLLRAGIDKDNIAVVTPFRRQVMQIRHFVRRKVGEDFDLPVIDTVERVQGLTVEMVIVSLCTSAIEYIESMAEFLFSPNRLNVSVSRSRTKSIVISHPDIFNCLPRTFNGLEARNICQRLLNSELSLQIDYPIENSG